MPVIAFITRGNTEQGLGHLYRVSRLCVSIAGSGSEARLVVYCLPSELARSFPWPECCEVHLVADPAGEVCSQPAAEAVVVDWLNSEPAIIERLAGHAGRVILLDDTGPAQESANLVINALVSTELDPPEVRTGKARVVGGKDYVQLPPEVTKLRAVADSSAKAMSTELSAPLPPPSEHAPVQAVMLSFGWSRAGYAVQLALRALAESRFSGKVLVMPSPADPDSLSSLKAAAGRLSVDWLGGGPDFHSLLASVDLAILAGGLTLYEACFLGIPTLSLALVDHQLYTARKLEGAGACVSAGLAAQLKPSDLQPQLGQLLGDARLRQRLSAAAMNLLDGRGLKRTVDAIMDPLTARG